MRRDARPVQATLILDAEELEDDVHLPAEGRRPRVLVIRWLPESAPERIAQRRTQPGSVLHHRPGHHVHLDRELAGVERAADVSEEEPGQGAGHRLAVAAGTEDRDFPHHATDEGQAGLGRSSAEVEHEHRVAELAGVGVLPEPRQYGRLLARVWPDQRDGERLVEVVRVGSPWWS